MAKIAFDKDISRLLGTITEEGEVLPFPDWDVLKELDRREKRSKRDGGKRVRKWIREHPEEVTELIERRKLDMHTYCPICHKIGGEHGEGCSNRRLS